ncbi:hypothetical protein [Nafulsella turpanensis]|uniref:hypothetical protein n=1 Tax=Nafulsella turpanensis TaxID=1265690 RepID=UPI00037C1AB7|nr:hypothetical protein [Nafulsella turpanensis]
MITKNCAHCSKEFEAQRSNAKYCRQSCRTMASNTKNGFKIGRIRIKEKDKDLAAETPFQVAPQGINGINTGRAYDEVTGAGTIESFFGSSIANIITQLITRGEYDERIAKLQRTLNYIVHLLEKIAGVKRPQAQPNKGIPIPKINQQTQGMPLINFPDGPMV